MGMKRSDSGSSFGAEPNRNTEWLKMPYFFFAYYSLLVAGNWVVYLVLRLSGKQYPAYSWTFINALHSVVSFLIMHWWKGVPFQYHGEDSSKYDKDTFWEQIDDGRQWTPIKKKFMVVPPVLLVMAVVNCPGWTSVFVNFVFFLIAFLGKLPAFHHMRILGINRD